MIFLILLVTFGRLARKYLILGPNGQWREDLLFESKLPELEEVLIEVPPPKPPFYINQTTADTLCYIKGVGPVLAGRIIAYRDSVGKYTCPEDLQQVKGVGNVLSRQIDNSVLYRRSDLSNQLNSR